VLDFQSQKIWIDARDYWDRRAEITAKQLANRSLTPSKRTKLVLFHGKCLKAAARAQNFLLGGGQ
jgi:hypothetical protein